MNPCRFCRRGDHAEAAHRDEARALAAGCAALEAGNVAEARGWLAVANVLRARLRRRWVA